MANQYQLWYQRRLALLVHSTHSHKSPFAPLYLRCVPRRVLGLRHIVILNNSGGLLGLITRHDLIDVQNQPQNYEGLIHRVVSYGVRFKLRLDLYFLALILTRLTSMPTTIASVTLPRPTVLPTLTLTLPPRLRPWPYQVFDEQRGTYVVRNISPS